MVCGEGGFVTGPDLEALMQRVQAKEKVVVEAATVTWRHARIIVTAWELKLDPQPV